MDSALLKLKVFNRRAVSSLEIGVGAIVIAFLAAVVLSFTAQPFQENPTPPPGSTEQADPLVLMGQATGMALQAQAYNPVDETYSLEGIESGIPNFLTILPEGYDIYQSADDAKRNLEGAKTSGETSSEALLQDNTFYIASTQTGLKVTLEQNGEVILSSPQPLSSLT